MATDTRAQYLGVIHGGRHNGYPGGREFFVAGFAKIGGVKVRRPFATGDDTIMTTCAIIDEWRMVHRGGQPRADLVTDITFIQSRNVRGTFTGGDHVVVATGAGTNNFVMIHGSWCYW